MNSYWNSLEALSSRLKNIRIETLCSQKHFKDNFLQFSNINLDLSKNKVNEEVIQELLGLAVTVNLDGKINALYNGENINSTEDRPAKHILLRAEQSEDPLFNEIQVENNKAARLADRIRSKELTGFDGKVIDTIINIGVGGSDLGARLLLDAFKGSALSSIKTSFISDIDFEELELTLESVDLGRTLFIVCSKSFCTLETMTNAKYVLEHYKKICKVEDWKKHFVGVSANNSRMSAFGISKDMQFKMWDCVGGRYSIWSTVGLICRIALGNEIFQQFLDGGRSMDQHFLSEDWRANLPIMMALIQVWNINFLGHNVFLTHPYKHALRYFPEYQQQLEMESNGKSVSISGEKCNWATSPYVFGELGFNAQHAYMQLIHQSEMNTYIDFIAVPEKNKSISEDIAFRNCLAQSRALMLGIDGKDESYKTCPGDRPSSTVVLNELTPFSLGELIAMYEHKVFVQSVIWNINPFDQFGVQLGKSISSDLIDKSRDLDPSTQGLINHFSQK